MNRRISNKIGRIDMNLTDAYFYGDAPDAGSEIFSWDVTQTLIHYKSGTSGWTNPWHGYQTIAF